MRKSNENEAKIDISKWVKECIEGNGGLLDYKRRELEIRNESDEVAAANWVIRCLANPYKEGSEEVIQAIIENREKVRRYATEWVQGLLKHL